jgi:hypothetical protein
MPFPASGIEGFPPSVQFQRRLWHTEASQISISAEAPANHNLAVISGMFGGRRFSWVVAMVRLGPLVAAAFLLMSTITAVAGSDPVPRNIAAAVEYCTGFAAGSANDDPAKMCFDGEFFKEMDLSWVEKLAEGGIFVIRSRGGFIESALRLAEMLYRKNAVVVLRDYCLSACANYLLPATRRTYVMPQTLVGWHGGPKRIQCQRYEMYLAIRESFMKEQGGGGEFPLQELSGLDKLRELKGRDKREESLKDTKEPEEVFYCRVLAQQRQFFAKRKLDDRYVYHATTAATRVAYEEHVEQAANPHLAWLWHPKNQRGYFSSNIVYFDYPRSQADVDALILSRRWPFEAIFDQPVDRRQ